jgi:hypothetical protein
MKIFISHSHQDSWVAQRIAQDLKDRGVEVFMAEKNIITGEHIDKAIKNGIAKSDHLLLLISPASLRSNWIFIETGMALALNKTLIPILLNVGENEVPELVMRQLARGINEIERYYHELEQQNEESSTSSKEPVSNLEPALQAIEAKYNNPPEVEVREGASIRVVDHSLLSEAQKKQPPVWVPEMNRYSGQHSVVTLISPDGWVALENIPFWFRRDWVELLLL